MKVILYLINNKLHKHHKYNWLYIFIISLFVSNNIYSQQNKDSLFVLDAVILSSDSLLPVKNVHVISKFNRWGTITNEEGRFKLYVQYMDSILISSIGFSSVILQIDSSILAYDSIYEILITKDTVTINEVVIRGYWDYSTMKEIIINMTPVDLSQFYPSWENTELLYLEPHPMTFKGPIQALYDAFNRSARLQRRLIKNRREYNKIMIMMGRYLDTIPAKPEHMQVLPN